MSGFRRYDYLLSALPALEPIGSIPPMSKRDFLEQVIGSKGPAETVEMILLGDDIAQYEALLAEEIEPSRTDLAVLSVDKAESEPVLPAFLLSEEVSEGQDNKRLSTDEIWSRYFHRAAFIAKRRSSGFLRDWVGFEVGLRNALVAARAQILELDYETYLVAQDLADKDIDYGYIVSAWSAAADPRSALEALDKARWEWLDKRGRWYSFAGCEIEVYAAKLILLCQWRRILSDKQKAANVV
ncbi:MAG: DUF2764 family protein [Sedimentisphaerales bacterium]|nr:DUF2764 family protein [Sedimentisphaerales bacterium]